MHWRTAGNYETDCSILAKTKITKNCLHTLCSILNVIVSLSLITIAGWYQVLGCIKNAMVINLSGLRETVCFINKHPLLSLSKNSLFHNSLTWNTLIKERVKNKHTQKLATWHNKISYSIEVVSVTACVI